MAGPREYDMPVMYRWILAVSAGIVLGLIAVSTSVGAVLVLMLLLAFVHERQAAAHEFALSR